MFIERLVVVLSLVIGSPALAGAQNTEHWITFVQSPPSPMIVSFTPNAPPLASSVLLIQHQRDFHDGHGFRITGNYWRQNPDSFSPLQETRTSFVTESRLPVTRIWGARLQVSFFAVTLHTGNVMLGPLASSEAFHRPRQFGEPRSADLYGVGLSVPLGRDARWEGSRSLWRGLTRIVHGDDCR